MKKCLSWTSTAIALTIFLGLRVNISADSPSAHLQQLVKQLQAAPDNYALRVKIAKTAASMHPRPTVPESARRYLIQATTLQKHATTTADYALAIEDYKKALLVAPWWSDAYFDFAIALELAQQYPEAIENLKLSVMADPNGNGARAAQDKLYEVEAEQQKADADKTAAAKAQAEQDAAAAQKAQAETMVETFQGTWYGSQCYVAPLTQQSLDRGCTDADRHGLSWHEFGVPTNGVWAPLALSFTLPRDGTVVLNSYTGYARCPDVVGIPQGSSFSGVRWEARPKDGPARVVYSETNSDGNYLIISCDRPLVGADPNAAYHYVWWDRKP